ncbi:MAG: trypsin-like serine protease [Planctomycetes bacterium]|nr:trypsin-like serine protease [Planctomycetota bacterium]
MVFRQSVYSRVSFVAAFALLACFSLPSSAETVLLDFNSPTCGPCQQMRPTIGRLAAAGHKVQHIDITRDPQTASRFGVSQVPTFIVLVDGQVAARSMGITSYGQLTQMLTGPGSQSPQPRSLASGQSPSTFATPVAMHNGPTAAANSLATAQPGRVVPIQPQSLPSAAPQSFAGQTPGQPIHPTGSSPGNSRLIEATVKVAVKDSGGVSAGTGTIVDARQGEALILTCGHLFRSSNGQGPITVTMFQAGPTGAEVRSTAVGRLVDFDLDRDLALVSFRPEVAVQPIPIAPTGAALTPGAAVTSVGCNNGQNPTLLATKITAVDRYQGPPNVEIAGAPVEGRSGGGLFNAQGQLIGVCFAADPQSNEGLYASLPSVQAKLDSLGLAMVYQSPSTNTNSNAAAQPAQQTLAAAPEANFAVRGQGPTAPPQPFSDMPFAEAVNPTAPPTALSPVERATFEEIQRRMVDSEVICIIRPKSPDGKSEVITLSSASPELVKTLRASAVAQRPAPTATRLLR